MSHRDEVLFFQEIKFRNKLVEYLSDWVAHATIEETEMSYEITVNSRYIVLIESLNTVSTQTTAAYQQHITMEYYLH